MRMVYPTTDLGMNNYSYFNWTQFDYPVGFKNDNLMNQVQDWVKIQGQSFYELSSITGDKYSED